MPKKHQKHKIGNPVFRVEYDNDTYKIHVNVKDFKPEELVVKTVDNTVKVPTFATFFKLSKFSFFNCKDVTKVFK